MQPSYLTPNASIGSRPSGELTCFANAPIRAGETVAAFGGRAVTRAFVDMMSPEDAFMALQIDEGLFLVSDNVDPSDRIHHCCDPNCGISGASMLVALRDIAIGEELTFDYAMSEGSDFDEFECACGSALCRSKVTGHDWMLPELQRRYRGHFSPYLAKRISELASIGSERRAFAY
jgi:hypothetical protein